MLDCYPISLLIAWLTQCIAEMYLKSFVKVALQ